MRPSNRAPGNLRDIEIIRHYTKHAEGSVLVKFGDTHVISLFRCIQILYSMEWVSDDMVSHNVASGSLEADDSAGRRPWDF